jgi:hypothetical protein
MTNRSTPVQRQSRFPVSWPVLYGGDEVLAEGTVLDLTKIGWRVEGTLPVRPGMQLTLIVWVPEKRDPIRIERATVMWVNGCEFAIEACEMAPGDQTWVTAFLNQELELWSIARASDDRPTNQSITETSSSAGALPQTQFSLLDDLILWLLGAQADMRPLDPAVNQREIPEFRGRDEETYLFGSDRWLREVWYPALRIVRGMRARRTSRAVTGKDSISDN